MARNNKLFPAASPSPSLTRCAWSVAPLNNVFLYCLPPTTNDTQPHKEKEEWMLREGASTTLLEMDCFCPRILRIQIGVNAPFAMGMGKVSK